MTRNVTAVSQKCMAFSKDVYEKAGGFDESSLSAVIDFCIDVQKQNRWNVYTPYVKMTDHRKKQEDNMGSVDIGHERYQNYLSDGDPFYNSLLNQTSSIPVQVIGI
jgi:hypothetical protein